MSVSLHAEHMLRLTENRPGWGVHNGVTDLKSDLFIQNDGSVLDRAGKHQSCGLLALAKSFKPATTSLSLARDLRGKFAVRYTYFRERAFVREDVVWRTPLGAVTPGSEAVFSHANWAS